MLMPYGSESNEKTNGLPTASSFRSAPELSAGGSEFLWELPGYPEDSSHLDRCLTNAIYNTQTPDDYFPDCRLIALRHDRQVSRALLSPDGQTVLTVASGGPARLWDSRCAASWCSSWWPARTHG